MGEAVSRRGVTSTKGRDFSHQHSCWQKGHLSVPLVSIGIVSWMLWGGTVHSENQQII